MRVSEQKAARRRDGMSLVEVLVALALFAGSLLSMGAFAGRLAHAVAEGSARTTAVDLATDRIEAVKSATKYNTLETLYVSSESSIAGFPGFSRQTIITRVGGGPADLMDYKIVTVIITTSALKSPVRKTSIISEF